MPENGDHGPFCCGKASWWAVPKGAFVCSVCGKAVPERLTACKECKHSIYSPEGGSNLTSCYAQGRIPVFDCWNGTWTTWGIIPLAVKINTGKEPCPYFEAKQ